MEQHFLAVGKPAWDAYDWAPRPQPAWLLVSEGSGPGPLPLYPALGESADHRDALDRQLLSSACWRLPFIHEGYTLLSRAQSPWEARPLQPSLGPAPDTAETPETPQTPETPETPDSPPEPAREPEPRKETESQRLSQAEWPSVGVGLQTEEKCEDGGPAERRPARAPGGWGRRPGFCGCLRWVRRAVCTLRRAAAGCCGTFWDVKEP
ncbi:annexin-2 receptor-like [Phyllostomus hastatus]|uniref:annexin-2 receptor-like n=1 Tax=Phyllostomus hastatus TaxID=9423 RepID=UPI001E685840|nr:annexin-2 receptor-like [Phyllostomus hastatus]